jgi:MFS family permease
VFAALSYPLGVLADRLGLKKVFIAGLFLFAIVYAGFAMNPGTLAIFLLFIVYGIYAAATEGISKAWITNIAHGRNTATAIGFFTSAESFCTLLASIIAGTFWEFTGSTLTFFITSIAAIAVIIFLLSQKKTDPT